MEKVLDDMLPIMDVEHDCILSKQGDITIVFRAELPEIFTLSDNEYEAFHQVWIKALKVLPKFSVFHKQDWFIDSRYEPDFLNNGGSFLSRASERFFTERPFLDHTCYILLTQKPAGRKPATSLFSNLLRRTIVPEQTLQPQTLQDFLDAAGQFRQILEDCGLIRLGRLKDEELRSSMRFTGLVEKYCSLSEDSDEMLIRDISFADGIQIGNRHCQLYTLGDAADLPPLCGSRINFER
ncbi:MAG: DUF3875 domain-containing protein, partial [Bacteroidetes bacterium]|nr:DUF3875 domain-containing protein [Bacteroidota bacterium]